MEPVLSALFFGLLLTSVLTEPLCNMNSSLGWRRDPNDCSTAYFCFMGNAVPYKCPEGHVIGAKNRLCVPVDSKDDDCTKSTIVSRTARAAVARDCKLGTRTPSPASCAKYYECVTSEAGYNTLTSQECPYPTLFDVNSKKCSNFQSTTCGSKIVPKSPCDYDSNQCHTAHCIPCSVRFPSCTGRQNGLHSWEGREWSPYFVECAEGRVASNGRCKSEKENQIFHPELRKCVQFDDKSDLVG